MEGDVVCKLHLTLFERKWKTEDCFVMIWFDSYSLDCRNTVCSFCFSCIAVGVVWRLVHSGVRNSSTAASPLPCTLPLGIPPSSQGKGKVHPITGHEGPKVEYNYTLSLTSALDIECAVNATPRPLYPHERNGTHCTGVLISP
jgi:hypothetical protein